MQYSSVVSWVVRFVGSMILVFGGYMILLDVMQNEIVISLVTASIISYLIVVKSEFGEDR